MSDYKYNAAKHAVEEQATMLHPHDWLKATGSDAEYSNYCEQYANSKASLKSYPVQGSVKWVDGQDIPESWFEIKECPEYLKSIRIIDAVAYPLQQAEEDELWNEVVAKSAAANIMGVSPSRPDAINTWKKDISKYLKQHFTITRKQ